MEWKWPFRLYPADVSMAGNVTISGPAGWASRLDYVPAVATDSAALAAGNAPIKEPTMARSTSVLDSITVTLT